MRDLYLVTYDITEPKRLRRVFKLLRGFGDHIQYSVFRCELTEQRRRQLVERLAGIINERQDQVLFFSLGPPGGMREQEVESVGRPYRRPCRQAIIV